MLVLELDLQIFKNFTEGDLKPTGNPLDIAIVGKGFFQITLPSGEIAYSRNGNFKLDAEGTIVNGNGYALEPQIVVPQKAKDLSIGNDGFVTARDPQTGDTIELGQITLVDFINPAGLAPLGDSLFMQTDASGDVVQETQLQSSLVD